MKFITAISILLFTTIKSQFFNDSILGKPKYVKEYLVFLNNSEPFTFMEGDGEYGHAVIPTPENLRSRMRDTWFTTDFVRYTNNETFYDIKRNITKEIWYYKSGKILDEYNYRFDELDRKIGEDVANDIFTRQYRYFYNQNGRKVHFIEQILKFKSEPTDYGIINLESYGPLTETRFDAKLKVDSVFTITNEIWKQVGERSFVRAKDSVYHKKLSSIKIYNDNFKVIEEKKFKPGDYQINKIFLDAHFKYEYDSLGRIKKETETKDNKYHFFILEKNGKYREEIKEGAYANNSATEYSYYTDGKMEEKTQFYQGNISHQIRFEYQQNRIKKLFYLDTFGKKKDDLNPDIITFKYKIDNHKNWVECVKNVNGKDLYIWKREIQYF